MFWKNTGLWVLLVIICATFKPDTISGRSTVIRRCVMKHKMNDGCDYIINTSKLISRSIETNCKFTLCDRIYIYSLLLGTYCLRLYKVVAHPPFVKNDAK
ncbi:hypothetical protein D910_12683, partial [Dendroctonus ponderosae]